MSSKHSSKFYDKRWNEKPVSSFNECYMDYYSDFRKPESYTKVLNKESKYSLNR